IDAVNLNLTQILKGTAPCQTNTNRIDGDSTLDESQYSEIRIRLLSISTELAITLATVMVPGFSEYLYMYLSYIIEYYTYDIAEMRSMAIQCLAKLVCGLRADITEYTELILTTVLQALGDQNDEVRSKAAYTVGIL